jgi:hypothetical protein
MIAISGESSPKAAVFYFLLPFLGVGFMLQGRLLVLVLILLVSSSLGCGEGPKREEGKDPFKARQETQKEKNQDKFMKPRMPGGPKGQ